MDNNLSPRQNKSQRKREMLALQDIGNILVELSSTQLAQIPLEPELAKAIEVARSLKSREAKRRQLQYIGKLMRHVDVEQIQTALSKLQLKNKLLKTQFHKVERLRDKLIAEGDTALEELINQYPDADKQRIRQLIRKAKQDQKTEKNSGAATELFRYLQEIIKME